MDLLLATFFEQYGLIIILVVGFALMMVYYFLRNRKFQQTESEFVNALKVGDKVKTYSGFYGTVEKITETTDGKVVTLRLGEKATVDVDIRALMGLDHKEEVKDEPAADQELNKEELEEKLTKVFDKKDEEKPAEEPAKEEKAEEPKPAKKPRAKKTKKEDKE